MRTQDAKHIREGIMAARKCMARYRETQDSSEYYIMVNKQYTKALWTNITRQAFQETSKKLCKRHNLPFWMKAD